MPKSPPIDSADAIIKAHRKYRLAPYREILAELIEHAGPIESLKDRSILEIGPGNRVDLMKSAQETALISCDS